MKLSKKARGLAAVLALTLAAGIMGGCGGDKNTIHDYGIST